MINLKDWKYSGEFLSLDQKTYGKKYYHPILKRNVFIGRNTAIRIPEQHFVRIESSDYTIKPIIQKFFKSEKEAHNFAYRFMRNLK